MVAKDKVKMWVLMPQTVWVPVWLHAAAPTQLAPVAPLPHAVPQTRLVGAKGAQHFFIGEKLTDEEVKQTIHAVD